MAKLFFRYGTMGSGKSAHLLITNFNYIERGMKTLIFTSSKDDRYGKNIIKSRIGIEANAISINDSTDIFTIVKNSEDISCVFLDEAQFVSKEHIFQLIEIVDELNIPVIAYGLRSDFQLNTFIGSSYLMALSDEITELKNICWCGKKAVINARIMNGKISNQGEQIQIGGNESYVSLCRKHYKEGRLK